MATIRRAPQGKELVRKAFWSRDAVAVVVVAAAFAVLAATLARAPLVSLERSLYDFGISLDQTPPSPQIAIVAIDEPSIERLGRWPWPRQRHAELIDRLAGMGAQTIVSTIFYPEPESDAGHAGVQAIREQLQQSPLSRTIPDELDAFDKILADVAQRHPDLQGVADAFARSAAARKTEQEVSRLDDSLAALQRQLTADDVLGQAIARAGNVLLPMNFQFGRPQSAPDLPLPDYVKAQALPVQADAVPSVVTANSAQWPVATIGRAAAGIGNLITPLDTDGVFRSIPLLVSYGGQIFPAMSLLAATRAGSTRLALMRADTGLHIQLGEKAVRTGLNGRFFPHFHSARGGHSAFPEYSAYEILDNRIPTARLRGHIVLIGAIASGIGDRIATPIDSSTAPVEILADTLSSLLTDDGYWRPGWADDAEWACLLLALFYLAAIMPRLGAVAGLALTTGLIIGLVSAELLLLGFAHLWLRLGSSCALLVAGHLVIGVKRLRLTERLRLISEEENAESNRMLGLAFQGQGQLDMALEKFQRVTLIDDRLLDLFYNLALDFERRRQFNKAEAVYRRIADRNPEYRDVKKNIARAQRLSDSALLSGSHFASMTTDGFHLGESDLKLTIGRYEIESELGKGAMGTVYLGRDPKIGRRVAIKTLPLSQEFPVEDLERVKRRFFREAESAGRLSHPHIVQIFDAGEDQDLAYIAMEFIEGHDLTRHTKGVQLLPIRDTIRYIADAAGALAYAHRQGIVHRDVKPANMMLEVRSRTIKMTDFGIARITDASRTRTGTVLGTPSYMSPEQLAGHRVEGASDLFSLGVSLYQLLTGSLPFNAESLSTLMFRIANEPHTPATELRQDLPAALVQLIDRALSKRAEARFANGDEMASALHDVLHTDLA